MLLAAAFAVVAAYVLLPTRTIQRVRRDGEAVGPDDLDGKPASSAQRLARAG